MKVLFIWQGSRHCGSCKCHDGITSSFKQLFSPVKAAAAEQCLVKAYKSWYAKNLGEPGISQLSSLSLVKKKGETCLKAVLAHIMFYYIIRHRHDETTYASLLLDDVVFTREIFGKIT